MPPPEQSKLKEKVRKLPNRPGVYLMKDQLGSVIYVGKAKNLKKRVATYFQPSRKQIKHPKIRSLVSMIRDFDILPGKNGNGSPPAGEQTHPPVEAQVQFRLHGRQALSHDPAG